MQITVQFQGSSDHFSNPASVNASFTNADGTSANINMSADARKELVLGQMYEIHIVPIQPLQFVDAAQAVDTEDEHQKLLLEENN